MKNIEIQEIKSGIFSSMPLVIGYIPAALAFGLLAKNTNILFIDCMLLSMIVFAGASQFMALDLIKSGAAYGNIILATFLLNLRHLMMSASLASKIERTKKAWLYYIAFGITDETFSVAALKKGNLSIGYLVALHTMSYLSWVLGTFIGYFIGGILPSKVQDSFGVGLYAMFIALLVPQIKQSIMNLHVVLIAAGVYILLHVTAIVSSNWMIVVTVLLSSLISAFILKDKNNIQVKKDSL